MYNTKVVEIIASIIAFLSVILNLLSIYLVFKLKKRQEGLNNGLGLILLVAFYDLLGPLLGITQEISIIIRTKHILTGITCQILGIIETLVPYLSSGVVALLSIERYLVLNQKILKTKWIISTVIIHFLIGLLFASLATINNDYELATSRMICMVNPRKSIFGNLWYFILLISLIIHVIIILFCYIKIMLIRNQLLDQIILPLDSINLNLNSDPNLMLIDQRLVRFNPIRSSLNTQHPNLIQEEIIESNNYNQSNKAIKTIRFTRSKFLLKAITILIGYLLCILPGIFVLLYDAIKVFGYKSIDPLLPELSALMFLPLFSLALINPILLLLLHTKVSNELFTLWYHLKDKF